MTRMIIVDSSTLGELAEDKHSQNSTKLQRVLGFERKLRALGAPLLITDESLGEISGHEDIVRARLRVRYIQSLPCVAIIKPQGDERETGATSILHLVGAEFKAQQSGITDLEEIRDRVRGTSFQYVAGSFATGGYRLDLESVKALRKQRQEQREANFVLERLNIRKNRETRLLALIKSVRERTDQNASIDSLRDLHSDYVRSLIDRSDYEFTRERAVRIADAALTPLIEYLQRPDYHDLEIERVKGYEMFVSIKGKGATLFDLEQWLSTRNVLLKCLPRKFHDKLTLENLDPKSLPTSRMIEFVRVNHQDTGTWHSSEENDRLLAAAAIYGEAGFIDMRAHDAISKKGRAGPPLTALISNVRRTKKAYEKML